MHTFSNVANCMPARSSGRKLKWLSHSLALDQERCKQNVQYVHQIIAFAPCETVTTTPALRRRRSRRMYLSPTLAT